jgi:hypothetical protein
MLRPYQQTATDAAMAGGFVSQGSTMDGEDGYIKLWRKIQEWGWYKAPDHVHLFTHLIQKARWRDGQVNGQPLKRGQLLTGRAYLSYQTGVSERSIRTILKHLKSTSEITIEATNQGSVITIVNYELYQSGEDENDQQNPELQGENPPQINRDENYPSYTQDKKSPELRNEKSAKSDQQSTFVSTDVGSTYNTPLLTSDQQVTSDRPASDQQVTTKKKGRIEEEDKKEELSDESDKSCSQPAWSEEEQAFEQARLIYPSTAKRGHDTEWQNFKKRHKDWRHAVADLVPAIKIQIAERERMTKQGEFVASWQNFKTWINNRYWEQAYNAKV